MIALVSPTFKRLFKGPPPSLLGITLRGRDGIKASHQAWIIENLNRLQFLRKVNLFIIIFSAAIYFHLDSIRVLLNIKTFQIGRLRVNMANSGKCRHKNEMWQLNNKWNQNGMIWDFNQLIRMKGFGSRKMPFERQTNLSAFISTLFPLLSRLFWSLPRKSKKDLD